MIRLALTLMLLLAPAAMAQTELPPRVTAAHGNVWLAGQPGAEDINAWADAGATAVINIRPEDERATLDFDEPSTVTGLDMSYTTMDVGGSAGFNPAMTAVLTEVLASLDGETVVLHCVSGNRAGHIYVAHLIETGQVAPEDAEALGLTPGGTINAGVLRQLSPRYAAAFPE